MFLPKTHKNRQERFEIKTSMLPEARPGRSLFFRGFWQKIGFAVVSLLLPASVAFTQEEAAAGPTGGGSAVWRIGFWEILHQTFRTDDDHPFYQMTGTSRFQGGKGFYGITTLDPGGSDLIPNVSAKNEDGHKSKDGTLTALFGNIPLLNGLPTFSVEYILPTGYIVGVGLEFAYTNTWIEDISARKTTTGADPKYATPLVRMASHFYMFSASVHPFGVPNPDDIDVFLGFGLARVESTLKYGIRQNVTIIDYAPITQTKLSGSNGMLSYQRLGLASGGESFGFMLEFLMLGNSEIIDNPFASNTIIDSTIYNDTYNNRGGSLPSKVGIRGGITRLSWTYSF